MLSATGGEQQEQQSALERELAAGRDVPRALTAADREQAQRVEANVRHVLRQASELIGGCQGGHAGMSWWMCSGGEVVECLACGFS